MRLCIICSIVKWAVNPRRWVEYYVERGYDVHVIGHGEIDIPGATMHHLTTISKINFITGPIQTRRIIKRIKPDIVHAYGITPFGYYGALSGFHPFIASAWGSDVAEFPEKSRILNCIVKYALKKADFVHTGDMTGKKRLMELGCEERKIFIQPSGIDTKRFSPKARSKSLRKKLGIDDKYSVFLGRRLEPPYSVDVFIKAIPKVLDSIDNVMFLVGGTGPLESEIKKLANDLGVSEHVIFIGGIPNEKMHEYLASVDVYVETRRAPEKPGGGIGAMTMEAMACGTPLILTEKPYLVTYANGLANEPWFRGVVYEPLDSEGLAEKIIYLLKNDELRKKLSEETRKIAIEIGDLSKNIDKWGKIYKSLKDAGKYP